MTRRTTHQTIHVNGALRSVVIERRAIAKREKLQAARQSPISQRSAAKSGDLAIPVAERNPWASAGLCGSFDDMPEKEI